MNQYFSADYILPVAGDPIANGIVGVDDTGMITGLWRDSPIIPAALEREKIKRFEGVIVPGFVNAHCHLELSHLQGRIPPKTGLVPFLQQVMEMRGTDEAVDEGKSDGAMRQADRQMQENGIVAVGDHANSAVSVAIKQASPLYYHTFLELMGYEPSEAEDRLQSVLTVKKDFGKLPVSITPHAPYSVSKHLFHKFRSAIADTNNPISMHNQESEAENEYFRFKTGDFVRFFESLGKDSAHFKPQGISSLRTIAALMPQRQRIQLVHNVFTSRKDAHIMSRLGRDVYWCLCPGANLYISDRLPSLDQLHEGSDFPITLGTDSLASNDRLCILSELKLLHKQYPELELKDTIHWATLNGAEFLGIADRFGSIEPGKRPGLNLLRNANGLALTEETVVEKLI